MCNNELGYERDAGVRGGLVLEVDVGQGVYSQRVPANSSPSQLIPKANHNTDSNPYPNPNHNPQTNPNPVSGTVCRPTSPQLQRCLF